MRRYVDPTCGLCGGSLKATDDVMYVAPAAVEVETHGKFLVRTVATRERCLIHRDCFTVARS